MVHRECRGEKNYEHNPPNHGDGTGAGRWETICKLKIDSQLSFPIPGQVGCYPGVYVFIVNGKPAYIGESIYVRGRVIDHMKNGMREKIQKYADSKIEETTTIAIKARPERRRGSRRAEEAALIRKIRPMWNEKMNNPFPMVGQ